MLTAYRFRLYPNKEQIETFSKYFGCSRVVWNKALELRESYHKEHKNDRVYEPRSRETGTIRHEKAQAFNRGWNLMNSFVGGCHN